MKQESGLGFSEKPSIILIGRTGCLARALKRYLEKEKIQTITIDISRKDRITNSEDLYNIFDKRWPQCNSCIVINLIASLQPKTNSDFYVNSFLARDLLNYKTSIPKFLIHISTINAEIGELQDLYTKQKRLCEEALQKSYFSNYIVLRMPLLIPIDDLRTGKSIPINYKKLLTLLQFPFISLVPPSRNTYRAIDVSEACNEILEFIRGRSILQGMQTYTLAGEKVMSLLDISETILEITKKKGPFLMIQILFPWKLLDIILSKFPSIHAVFKENTTLQQFLKVAR